MHLDPAGATHPARQGHQSRAIEGQQAGQGLLAKQCDAGIVAICAIHLHGLRAGVADRKPQRDAVGELRGPQTAEQRDGIAAEIKSVGQECERVERRARRKIIRAAQARRVGREDQALPARWRDVVRPVCRVQPEAVRAAAVPDRCRRAGVETHDRERDVIAVAAHVADAELHVVHGLRRAFGPGVERGRERRRAGVRDDDERIAEQRAVIEKDQQARAAERGRRSDAQLREVGAGRVQRGSEAGAVEHGGAARHCEGGCAEAVGLHDAIREERGHAARAAQGAAGKIGKRARQRSVHFQRAGRHRQFCERGRAVDGQRAVEKLVKHGTRAAGDGAVKFQHAIAGR